MVQARSVNRDFELEVGGGLRRLCGNVRQSPDVGTAAVGGEVAHSPHPLEVVGDVVSVQLATVHRRLVVPVDILADLEGEGADVGGDFPALCQLTGHVVDIVVAGGRVELILR